MLPLKKTGPIRFSWDSIQYYYVYFVDSVTFRIQALISAWAYYRAQSDLPIAGKYVHDGRTQNLPAYRLNLTESARTFP